MSIGPRMSTFSLTAMKTNSQKKIETENFQNNVSSVSPNLKPTEVTTSYAKATATERFSKRENAIVLHTYPGIKQKEYVIKVAALIDPKFIRYTSRISNSRFCIHFSNKEVVDNLLKQHKSIIIDDKEIFIKRLVNPARRIIISNACPSIPHEMIERELKNLGLRLVSPMHFLRAGYQDPRLAHVLSFRRQVYIPPDDLTKLPSSLLIKHENVSYRIFCSEDIVSCFICKQPGHISTDCLENENHDEMKKQMPSSPY